VTRAGFVALAGRPNVGKSTLLNAAVGGKVAIVSDRAQTTRRAVRGVRTERESQLVLVDLPGVQRPRDALTARMVRRACEELVGADAALLVLSGEQRVGPGDRFIARTLREAQDDPAHPVATAVAVNKVDRLTRAGTLQALREAAELGLAGEVFPVSARTGEGVGELLAHLQALMPEGPFVYLAGERSDQPAELLVAELIREAAIRRTFQELPHALEVVVEELAEREPAGRRARRTWVQAAIWVESASQRGIVVGAKGRMIKAIGTAARRELERALGGRVHLELSVRVRREWRQDEVLLDRLGIG
jgi:GTP-binding protein Era